MLSHLNQLNSIDIVVHWDKVIPSIAFGKWIRSLEIHNREINNQDIIAIAGLLNLNSLTMHRCTIDSIGMQTIIHCLSSRLENLKIKDTSGSSKISFKIISECSKLKTLTLKYIINLVDEEFDLLSKCTHLERIIIKYCNVRNQTIKMKRIYQ
jgi:hypothetical protein